MPMPPAFGAGGGFGGEGFGGGGFGGGGGGGQASMPSADPSQDWGMLMNL